MPRGANLRGNNWETTGSTPVPTDAPTSTPTDEQVDTPVDAHTDTSANMPDDTSAGASVTTTTEGTTSTTDSTTPSTTDTEEHDVATMTTDRPSGATAERDSGKRAGESITASPTPPRGVVHGHGLLDTATFTDRLTSRWRPVRGASVNVALDAYLSAQLDDYCTRHKVPKRVVVSWLVAELVGKEER